MCTRHSSVTLHCNNNNWCFLNLKSNGQACEFGIMWNLLRSISTSCGRWRGQTRHTPAWRPGDMSWKVEREARTDPPFQTENFLPAEAMMLTFMVLGARAVISFCILSAIPGNMVEPPESTMLANRSISHCYSWCCWRWSGECRRHPYPTWKAGRGPSPWCPGIVKPVHMSAEQKWCFSNWPIFFNSGHLIGLGDMCPQIKSIYFLVLLAKKWAKKALKWA